MARGRSKKKSSKLPVSDLLDDTSVKRKRKTQSRNCPEDLDAPGPSGCQNSDKNKNKVPRDPAADAKLASSSTDGPSSESDYENATMENDEENSSGGFGNDVNEASEPTFDEETPGFVKLEAARTSDPSVEQGLKKIQKRIFLQDGKVLGVKSERKDKGKARFTAYMLWAKEIRRKLLDKHTDMDFGTVSKRLGELWAAVPNLEKCNWRRRAKRTIFNPGWKDSPRGEPAWKIPAPTSSCKFINRIQNVKEKKSSIAQRAKQHVGKEKRNLTSSTTSGRVENCPPDRQPSPIGTRPVDVAAYLTLLGESLTVIGELLTNFEGKIAVSGSLSVLLDSLLCALGPLICLTQQVPEADGAEPETLAKMLDNLAYIMPGL